MPLGDGNRKVDGKWKEWKGRWEVVVDEGDDLVKKGQDIAVVEDEEGGPCLKLDVLPSMKLVKAATATVSHGKEKTEGVDLVVDGLDMMLALGCDKEGKQSLEIWPGFLEDPVKCQKR